MKSVFVKELKRNILIVTGTCRAGKTTLCKALASAISVEFLDEPWMPMFLPLLVKQAQIERSVAKSFMHSYFDELCNDMLLYRRANFRPGDGSSIWSFKKAKDIFYRLNNVNSRGNVESWIDHKNTIFVIALPEITPFIDFFLSEFESISIVHLHRQSDEIAALIKDKSWYADEQLLRPKNNQPYSPYDYSGHLYHMPWWLSEQDFKRFLNSSEYERGLIYSECFSKFYSDQMRNIPHNNSARIINVDFDDIVKDETLVLSKVNDFIEGQFGCFNSGT